MAKVEVEEISPGVACIRLNRPERMNALDDDLLCHDLPRAVAQVEQNDEIQVAIFTGTGEAFCGGADLEGCSAWEATDAASSEDFVRWTCELPVAVRRMRTLSIAAVNGPAVGAGFGLALACDFRFVGRKAFFKSPFIEMGLVPDYGLSYFLPRLVGIQDAMDIMLTARRIDADEARALGIAWRVTDDPMGDATDYARVLAGQPRRAAQVTRGALYASEFLDVETEILVEESRSQGIAMNSSEFAERFGRYRSGIGARS